MVISQVTAVVGSLNWPSIVLLLVVLLLTIKIRRPRNLPPGPRPLPFLGNVRCWVKSKLHLTLENWAEQYGSVMSVWFGRRLVVVLNDMQAVKEALVKQADCFSDRAVEPAAAVYAKGSMAMSNGEEWKEMRRFGLTAMRNLGVGKRSVENKINEEARYLLESFDHEGEKPFDPGHDISNAVSNIICRISFGQRFEYTDPAFAEMVASMKAIFSSGSIVGFSEIYGFLHRAERVKTFKKIQNISSYIDRQVMEHRETFDPNDIRDIIDTFLHEIMQMEKQGIKTNSPLQTGTIWRGIYDLFAAGTDTTANTLMWLVLYMATYPDVQTQVQREIDDVIGSSRQPQAKDRNNMPYTEAVLMEIQRLQPVFPGGVPRMASYETDLFGYTIPAKTTVIVNIWRILNDPKVWKDPRKFDPTRFLCKDGQPLEKYEAFIPFGYGRRICLGETLAKMEMFIFFVNLLQRFTFSLPIGKPRPSLDGVASVILSPRPFEVVAKERY